MQLDSFNLSHCEQSLQSSRGSWEKDFESNQVTFSQKVAEGIIGKIFLNFQESFNDPYIAVPTKQSPLVNCISFEIVKSKNALRLKEFASDAAELPPFKEWFDRFITPSQKVSNEQDFSSSSIYMQCPEKEKGIDREYFQELIALVGKSVTTHIKQSLDAISSSPENARLKAEVTWHRKEEQLISSPSNFGDNHIEIKLWLEGEEKTQREPTGAVTSSVIQKLREQKQKTQFQRQILCIAGVIALVSFFLFRFSGLQSRNP